MLRLLVTAAVATMALLAGGCGPDEGPDLSRFAGQLPGSAASSRSTG